MKENEILKDSGNGARPMLPAGRMKNLNLVLKDKYYRMTGEPGKMYELRKPTKWILSRLLNKDGSRKTYWEVELCSGYRKNREKKLRDFRGWSFLTKAGTFDLPNGEKLEYQKGDIIIWL
jgi:hypothetical protein